MTPTRMQGPGAVRAAIDAARAEGRAALVAYLMAGYPDEDVAIAAAECAVANGADLLEIGVPFSDPVADGPVIAGAGRRALGAGGGLDRAVATIATLRDRVSVPILAMSYLNPLVARGLPVTVSRLADVGTDGVIVPDLPAGEEPAFERRASDVGLAICFLVAPNTSPPRLERAARASTGFLYVVPLYGVTGARAQVAETALPLLARVRAAIVGRVPVAAGFGISAPAQVATLAAAADAVVVGSALVAALGEGGPDRVGSLVRDLAAGARRAHPESPPR